jgi:uncharacterized membrane protein
MSGGGQWAILTATLLWAIEAVVAKKVMTGISSSVAAFGRMFFGAAIMLGYLAMTGRLGFMASLTGLDLGWIVFTSVFLLGYVSYYYAGLKHAPASIAASILVVGSVITNLLYAVFDARRYSLESVVGMGLIVAAAVALWYVAPRVSLRTARLSAMEPER